MNVAQEIKGISIDIDLSDMPKEYAKYYLVFRYIYVECLNRRQQIKTREELPIICGVTWERIMQYGRMVEKNDSLPPEKVEIIKKYFSLETLVNPHFEVIGSAPKHGENVS